MSIKNFIYPLLIFLIGIFVYSSSLHNQFALDDYPQIVDNPDIRNLDLIKIFNTATFPGNLYRPVVTLSYSITYKFFNLDPLPYHAINIFLHGLISVLVLILLLKFLTKKQAFLSALVFAVHPIHTEAVANIVGRTELLSSFFLLLTLISYLHYKNIISLVLICIFYFLALCSKESSLCLLLLAPVSVYFLNYKFKKYLKPYLVLVLVSTLYLILRYQTLNGLTGTVPILFLDNPLVELGFFDRALNSLYLLGQYIVILVCPFTLSADYSFNEISLFSISNLKTVLYLLVCFSFFIIALIGILKKNIYSFLAIWFFLSFIITSNLFFPIGTIFAERLAYFPSIGFIALVFIIYRKYCPGNLKIIMIPSLLLVFSSISYFQSLLWENNKTIHGSQITTSPNSAKTQLNYGLLLKSSGKLEEAKKTL